MKFDSQMVKLIWIPVLKMVLNEFGHVKCSVRSNRGVELNCSDAIDVKLGLLIIFMILLRMEIFNCSYSC